MGTQFLFTDNLSAALVAYSVKKYNEISSIPLGRTILQKICYFEKNNGVPLHYNFEIYNYGPYSQDLYFSVDDFIVDDLIKDESKDKNKSIYKPGKKADSLIKRYRIEVEKYTDIVDRIIFLFKKIKPTEFELYATVHYLCRSHSNYYSEKIKIEELIKKMNEVKGNKFSAKAIEFSFNELERVGLIP